MPPRNQIDINLAALPDDSMDVARALVNELSAIADTLTEVRGSLPAGAMAAARRASRGVAPTEAGTATSPSGAETRAAMAQKAQESDALRRGQQAQYGPEVYDEVARRKLQNLNIRESARWMRGGQAPGEAEMGVEEREAIQRMRQGPTVEVGGEDVPVFGRVRRGLNRYAQAASADSGQGTRPEDVVRNMRRKAAGVPRVPREPQDVDSRAGYADGGGGGYDASGTDAGDPGWLSATAGMNFDAPFEMPRYGDYTAQDSLNMVAKRLLKRGKGKRDRADEQVKAAESAAARMQEAGGADPNEGQRRDIQMAQDELARAQIAKDNAGFKTGTAGAAVKQVADSAAYFHNLTQQPILGPAMQAYKPQSLYEVGRSQAPAGGRTWSPLGVDLPVRHPLDWLKTSWSGVKQTIEAQKVGLGAEFLGANQANDMYRQALGSGLGHDEAISSVRTMGRINAGTQIAPMDSGALLDMMRDAKRAGADMDKFTSAIIGLGGAARAARMPVEEMRASAQAHGEFIQSIGGRMEEGVLQAGQWSAATGRAPQVAQAIRQNPLTVGTVYGKTGIMPNAQGLLGENQTARMGVDVMNDIYKQLLPSFKNEKVPTQSGKGFRTITKEDKAMAEIAKMYDLPLQEVERLFKGRGKQNRGLNIMEDTDALIENGSVDRESIINRLGKLGVEDAAAVVGTKTGKDLRESVQKAVDTQTTRRVGGTSEEDEKKAKDKAKATASIELGPHARKWFEVVERQHPGNKATWEKAIGKSTDATGITRRPTNPWNQG